MGITDFFETLEQHYANQLPFVVYSRPINSVIKCWLQDNDRVYKTSTFDESGFVFAPFNLDEDPILFNEKHSKHYTLEIDNLTEETYKDSEISVIQTNKNAHLELVKHGIDSIGLGMFKKVVLSRTVQCDAPKDHPIKIFKRLYSTYKNAMVYCWYHPKVGLWLGATPELLFKVEGLEVTTISLAGTKPFSNFESDVWTPKEKEEQQIVTNYISEQLKPYCNSITIKPLEIVRAGDLIHLKTRILSRLKSHSISIKTIIEDLHPTPAVCGFPRDKAKQFILDSEGYDRQFYTGFLGELNLVMATERNRNTRNTENSAYKTIKRHSNFYVNLRCMQILDDKTLIYVGGGITKDSDPENEWEETEAKSKTMLKIL